MGKWWRPAPATGWVLIIVDKLTQNWNHFPKPLFQLSFGLLAEVNYAAIERKVARLDDNGLFVFAQNYSKWNWNRCLVLCQLYSGGGHHRRLRRRLLKKKKTQLYKIYECVMNSKVWKLFFQLKNKYGMKIIEITSTRNSSDLTIET